MTVTKKFFSRRHALTGIASLSFSGTLFFQTFSKASAQKAPKTMNLKASQTPEQHDISALESTDPHCWRPNLHFTPEKGFMNDPCGLIFDGKYFHLYFQFNPDSPHVGKVSWGHALSEDLYHWKDCPIAIHPNKEGMVFTGSAVLDKENTSGLFPKLSAHPQENLSRLAVFYTKASETNQSQWLAWSLDGGLHYQDYAKNPVLDAGHNSFRDPKVFWHKPSRRWIMTVAEASKKTISIYGSFDLISWMHLSNFGPDGLLGTEWECPNLVELAVEDKHQHTSSGQTRWVLFVSINPGAPLGGSSTQYFIGHFDGERFTAENTGVGFTDFAKDNYALQFYNNFPGKEEVCHCWIGNWQYCEEMPMKSWSGAMSLPRKMTLRPNSDDCLSLIQRPLALEKLRDRPIDIHFPEKTARAQTKFSWLFSEKKSKQLEPHESFYAELPIGTALEFTANIKVEERGVRDPDGSSGRAGRVIIEFTNELAEKLSLGFDAASAQFWVDRGELRGFHHPFFTDSFSVALPKGVQHFSLQVILDGATLEVYINDGEDVGTFLIFPYHPLTRLSVGATNAAVSFSALELYALKRTMNRPFHRTPSPEPLPAPPSAS